MPFLLSRDGRLIVQGAKVATSDCVDCCGDRPDLLWVRLVDCCYGNIVFWVSVEQLLDDGSPIWTEGGPPVTVGIGPYCSTTQPDQVKTYAEIIAEDPDANFVFFDTGTRPPRRTGCNDPECDPCPRCCVTGTVGCGGNLICCEHGGSFRVSLGVTATVTNRERVFGRQRVDTECERCFTFSGEVDTTQGQASFGVTFDFECQADGTYLVRCIQASANWFNRTRLIEGFPHPSCSPPPNGFVPVIGQWVDGDSGSEDCTEILPRIGPASLFALTRGRALAFLAESVRGLVAEYTGGLPTACSGSTDERETIDRTQTTDECEQELGDALGNQYVTISEWTGEENCEGGQFGYELSYAGNLTLFGNSAPVDGTFTRYRSSTSVLVGASWAVDRAGFNQCSPTQCGDGPMPDALRVRLERAASGIVDRLALARAAKGKTTTASAGAVRSGCAGCGRDGGL